MAINQCHAPNSLLLLKKKMNVQCQELTVFSITPVKTHAHFYTCKRGSGSWGFVNNKLGDVTHLWLAN